MGSTKDTDQQLARRLAYVLMAGAMLVWMGIAIEAGGVQLAGVAVCLGAGGWLALLWWRQIGR